MASGMSRACVPPALACLALALGCPSNDDWTRYEGPYAGTSGEVDDDASDGGAGDEGGDGDDDGDDDDDEPGGDGGEDGAAEGDGGGDDGEPESKPLPSPVFPTPTLTCFEGPCVASGEGGGKELEGRDIVREAFYAVAGFPDLETYESHVNHEGFAPPQGGAIRRAQDAVRLVTALVVQSGIPACEAVPLEGEATLADVPGITLKFAPGERTIPADHLGEGETYDKQVVMTDASGATAVIETTCGRQAGFATMELVEAPGVLGRIELYWDETDSAARKLELISYRKDLDERVAFRFETWEEQAAFWLVRARPRGQPRRNRRAARVRDARHHRPEGDGVHPSTAPSLGGLPTHGQRRERPRTGAVLHGDVRRLPRRGSGAGRGCSVRRASAHGDAPSSIRSLGRVLDRMGRGAGGRRRTARRLRAALGSALSVD